ncbi:MAG: hypothetical protein ACRYG2_09340 [Janthinobacterium lividum]
MAGPEHGWTGTSSTAPALDVVLVHGLGVSNRHLVPSLRDRPRGPGLGARSARGRRSSKPDRDLSMVELASDPERVIGVVLTCPAPDPGRGRLLEQVCRLLVNGLAERRGMTLVAVTDLPPRGPGRHAPRAASRSPAPQPARPGRSTSAS